MKTLRNLTCAVAAAAAVAFCAPSARATVNFTTNYDELNITVTVQTNIEKSPSSDVYTYSLHTFTLDNAAILHLLEGPDWNDGSFPAGSKLVVGWDAGANVEDGKKGDILVVGPDGKTVLYDASEYIWSASDDAIITVNFYDEEGTYSGNINDNEPGHYDLVWFNNTDFELYDDGGSIPYLYIETYGPSTENFKQGWKNDEYTSWSDSEQAKTYGADAYIDGSDDDATVTVKISAHGHGPGEGAYYEYYY